MFYESADTFNVTLVTYSGMTFHLATDADLDDAKDVIRRRIRLMRKMGYPVEKIGHGEWEVQSPDDAGMVGGREGFIRLQRNYRRYRRVMGRKLYC